jgi:hypothetical protein
MSACFQLLDKRDNQAIAFVRIDDLLCQHFGVDPDPVKWYHDWYNWIGVGLAFGASFDKLRKAYVNDETALSIINWMDMHYVANTWRE